MRPTTVLLLGLLLLPPAAAPAPPPGLLPVLLSGTIAADATYEGVSVLVTGDLEIASGATLTLRGANVTVLSLDQQPIAITVRGGAALVLQDGADALASAQRGTRVRSAAVPFDLTLEPAATLAATNATVRDARMAIGGDAAFTDARLNLSAGGLVVEGALTVRGGDLFASPDPLVHVLAGSADIEGALLRDSGAEALRAEPGSAVRLAASRVEGASAYGVSLWGAQAILDGNDFASALDYAVRADDTALLFRGNTVTNHCAVFLNAGSTGTLEGNTLLITNHGITVRSSGAVRVANNTIQGGTQAIALVDSSPGTVENNTVGENNIGLLLRRGGAEVAGNRFHDNARGVWVADEPDPDPVVLRDNAFEGNTPEAARNDRTVAVDARWNWWGDAAGPGVAQTLAGPWDTTPWLAAPP